MPMEIQQTLNDKAQAIREGGQFLILSPQEGLAAALSALPFDLHYDKVNNIPSPRKKTTHCIPNRAYFPFSTIDVYKNPPMICRIRNLLRARGTINRLLMQNLIIFFINGIGIN